MAEDTEFPVISFSRSFYNWIFISDVIFMGNVH